MGFYTPNLKLFSPSDTDFVDVTADVANNMSIIDEALYESCVLDSNDSSFSNQPVPSYRNKHTYSTWNGGIRVWDNKASVSGYGINNWQPTTAEPNEWTPLASLLNGWSDVPGFKSYYRYSKEDTYSGGSTAAYIHLELRGRVMLGTNYSPITQNTVYQVTNNFPSYYFGQGTNGGFGPLQRVTMGNSPSSTTIWNSAYVMLGAYGNPDGQTFSYNIQLTRKAGTSAADTQSAGNSENYVCLDGVRFILGRDKFA